MSRRRIIIVGAGASGIALAARLSAGHDVVLLESGPADFLGLSPELRNGLDSAWTVQAAMPDGPLTTTYDTELLPGRSWRIARGRLFGGSSAVNGAYFQRPHPGDFAAWSAVGGDEWSYENCLPAMRRLETDLDFGHADEHGSTGPVPVQRWGVDDPLTAAFLTAVESHGGYLEVDKNSGGRSGVGLLPRNARGAQRWGMARAYAPLLGAVDIRSDLTVRRILLRDGTARGVLADRADGPQTLYADEVILCGGAIETPRLLMASGIGDPTQLTTPVVAALVGVGRGLSDHPVISLPWRPKEGRSPVRPDTAWSAAWNSTAGEYTADAFEVLFAVASTASIISGDQDAPGPFDLRISLSRPRSGGVVLPADNGPVIRYGYLDTPADIYALRDAVLAGVQLLQHGPLSDMIAELSVPQWASGRGAPSDDAAEWLRENLGTSLHSCGTARMGIGSDSSSVVDPHGRVHGTRALRVADTSILPIVPSRGTALTAVLVGERIAELIAAE